LKAGRRGRLLFINLLKILGDGLTPLKPFDPLRPSVHFMLLLHLEPLYRIGRIERIGRFSPLKLVFAQGVGGLMVRLGADVRPGFFITLGGVGGDEKAPEAVPASKA
jgi:hypothetical protein